MNRKILKTADGSSTIYVPELDEHYHSINGAIQESMHVFIHAGLKKHMNKKLKIFEMGFGTGLNCLLTFIHSHERIMEYTTIESYPLKPDILGKLNYSDILESKVNQDEIFKSIHKAGWNNESEISHNFLLRKYIADIKTYQHDTVYDLIYYDAFAPDVQPDLWSVEIFQSLFKSLSYGGILTTYCAKGEVRRRLQKSGFEVERIPGPPGKREMIRAIKPK